MMSRMGLWTPGENGAVVPATFIGASGSVSGGNITLPGGSQAGDLIIVAGPWGGGSPPSSPTGWTGSTYTWSAVQTSVVTGVYWKVLTSGDISSGSVVWSTSDIECALVYRGPTTAVVKATDADDGQSASSTSVAAPTSSSRGIVAFGFNLNGATPGTPSGFTSRHIASNFVRIRAADYLSGFTASTVTFTQSSGGESTSIALELQ